jgi:hypothetical protein
VTTRRCTEYRHRRLTQVAGSDDSDSTVEGSVRPGLKRSHYERRSESPFPVAEPGYPLYFTLDFLS